MSALDIKGTLTHFEIDDENELLRLFLQAIEKEGMIYGGAVTPHEYSNEVLGKIIED
jgi:hypothetical protein